jgi:hypothetical protein
MHNIAVGSARVVLVHPDALKPRKSKTLNSKPQTIATTQATIECHLMQPNTNSIPAQIEKKVRAEKHFL